MQEMRRSMSLWLCGSNLTCGFAQAGRDERSLLPSSVIFEADKRSIKYEL